MEVDEDVDADRLRDDLESTKQLLELEIRSKALLEKDNKRMQSELERMRNELMRFQGPQNCYTRKTFLPKKLMTFLLIVARLCGQSYKRSRVVIYSSDPILKSLYEVKIRLY